MAKNFVINIGSNGSIITLESRSKVYESYFFDDINTENNRETLVNLFKKNKNAPIYIILDNIGQSYNIKKFPKVGLLDLRKIVERKFRSDIPENDLKDKRFMGYNKEDKDFEYMFISSNVDEIIKSWFDFIEEHDNITTGVYMLPLATEAILKKIKKKLKTNKNKRINKSTDGKDGVKSISWDIVLVRTQVGGFREVVFMNNRIVFTRILNEDLSSQDKFDAQFRENVLRTVEYLKRFYTSFSEDNLNMYTIVDEETKTLLMNTSVNNISVRNFSYNEFSRIFFMRKKIGKYAENGADLIFGDLIVFGSKTINFFTREMKQIALISSIYKILRVFTSFLSISLILIFITGTIFLVRDKYLIDKSKKKFDELQRTFEIKNKQEFGSDVADFDDMIDATSFYLRVKDLNINPFGLIGNLSNFVADDIAITSLKWRMVPSKRGILYGGKEAVNLDSSLVNKSGKVDDLFKIYENIDNSLKNSLSDYNTKLSSLPRNINFNTNYFSFPLKIDIARK